MILRTPVFRAAALLNSRFIAKFSQFTYKDGLHDPDKHITMGHFFRHNYIDYWPMGLYPEVYLIGSVASSEYKTQIETALVQAINSKYNFKVSIDSIRNENLQKFFREVLKTEEDHLSFINELNYKLASSIVVRQSRWTWLREQQVRVHLTTELLDNFETFEEFVSAYNSVIQRLVQISHFGLSQKIQQQPTAQQKHYYNQLNDEVTGIQALKDNSKPQNSSLINRFMNYIHSA